MDDASQTGLPKWLADLDRLLAIRSHFVLSGNIRDTFLIELDGAPTLAPMMRALWLRLKQRGYAFFAVWDRVDGISVYPKEAAAQRDASSLLDLKLKDDGTMAASLDALYEVMKRAVSLKEARVAVVVDFASRISANAQHPSADEQRFFVGCEKLSLHAAPVIPRPQAGAAAEAAADARMPLFNPVIWLVNREQDLPSWFLLDSERLTTHVIPRPDYQTRLAAAEVFAPLMAGHAEAAADARAQYLRTFADNTDGMTLASMGDIVQLASQSVLGIADIDDAIRSYKVGALDNPWKKDYLKERIRGAMVEIEDRVKGQTQAATKTVDILMRSVTGLTGAQARSSSGRPRGILFFAGPTGVGKTELAKTLTKIIFGDERAYIRFDMSEFAEEHNSARLLGAPPGYVGYDAGGELTNAMREKPFSVVLFDEIEKAHPRLLDKFIQILEDGRLTDGRGETVYFSESIIIFTSNLGIYVEGPDGRRVQNVRPGDSYDKVERNVREAISNHFRYTLGRPEILNRIGENIVVFNFIVPDVAVMILDAMLRNIARRVEEEHGMMLELSPVARGKLVDACLADLSLGGRGIGNQLETALINPLARAIFTTDLKGCERVVVADITECDKVYTVTLQH
ncbi:MAG: ATP-dependent Clp protease ATP-binding subunit [Burkholderiales bacterium]|nr:ATP-dependent Clp protease ATP-binding subunit [Burkholderiales bacterium]